MTNRDKLRLALQLIDSTKHTLNRASHPCSACGLGVKEDWTQHQTGEALVGVESRLKRLLDHKDLVDWLNS